MPDKNNPFILPKTNTDYQYFSDHSSLTEIKYGLDQGDNLYLPKDVYSRHALRISNKFPTGKKWKKKTDQTETDSKTLTLTKSDNKRKNDDRREYIPPPKSFFLKGDTSNISYTPNVIHWGVGAGHNPPANWTSGYDPFTPYPLIPEFIAGANSIGNYLVTGNMLTVSHIDFRYYGLNYNTWGTGSNIQIELLFFLDEQPRVGSSLTTNVPYQTDYFISSQVTTTQPTTSNFALMQDPETYGRFKELYRKQFTINNLVNPTVQGSYTIDMHDLKVACYEDNTHSPVFYYPSKQIYMVVTSNYDVTQGVIFHIYANMFYYK